MHERMFATNDLCLMLFADSYTEFLKFLYNQVPVILLRHSRRLVFQAVERSIKRERFL